MNSLRNLFLAIPLLTLVGCGCTGDEGGGGGSPSTIRPFLVGTKVTPIPVQPVPAKIRIDVFFLMDDSGYNPNLIGNPANQPGMVYGDIVFFPAQARKKQDGAKEIFSDIVNKLAADLAVAYPADQFDLAFGVGRYEDFGGPFRADDKSARPFLLNQPIYRQQRDDFTTVFASGLNRTASGSGNDKAKPADPQSIVEALYQIGAGTGFDADGVPGLPIFGALAGQSTPDATGDVPAASFVAAGNDEDGEPKFTTPAGVAGMLASGDLGGVGWRRDALRYVITTSDIAGVAPVLGDALVTVPPAPGRITGVIRSAAGAAAYPRTSVDVPVQAFASTTGSNATAQQDQANGRFGLRPDPVAPANAHTIQQSVIALNTGDPATNGGQPLNIEVLSIGTLRTAPIPFKPNLPGANPLTGGVAAIPNPSSPDFSPFTWMSAYAKLTGAVRPYPGPADPILPLVYNITTVSPTAGTVNGDVREDLVYRIGQAKGTLPVGGPVVVTPIDYTFSLAIPTVAGPIFAVDTVDPVDTDGGGTTVALLGSDIRVRVPRYRVGIDPVPATIEIFWIVQIRLQDPLRAVLASDNLPFTITATTPLVVPASPAKGPHQGTVFYTAPLPAPAGTRVGTATLASMTVGCAFVALAPPDAVLPPPFTDRTDLGICP